MVKRQGPVRFEIVCTGNICRSPFIHAVLADAFEKVAPGEFDVASSGTHALTGSPPHHETRTLLHERGLSLKGYRAGQVTPQRLAAADVILVMDKEQRQLIIDEEPAAARRVFLVKELARLLGALDREQPWQARTLSPSDPSARGRWLAILRLAASSRERLRSDDDVLADPFKQGHEAFVLMEREASAAIDDIVAVERRLRPTVPAER